FAGDDERVALIVGVELLIEVGAAAVFGPEAGAREIDIGDAHDLLGERDESGMGAGVVEGVAVEGELELGGFGVGGEVRVTVRGGGELFGGGGVAVDIAHGGADLGGLEEAADDGVAIFTQGGDVLGEVWLLAGLAHGR